MASVSQTLKQKFSTDLLSTDKQGAYTLVPEDSISSHRPLSRTSSRRKTHLSKHHSFLPIKTPWQQRTEAFLNTTWLQFVSLGMITGNAICVGLETDLPASIWFDALEAIFLAFFTIEVALRLFAFRAFFFDFMGNLDFGWNVFDLIVVSIGLLTIAVGMLIKDFNDLSNHATLIRTIRVIRVLRIIRIVRVFRFLKQLYLLAYGFVEGANAVFWVATLASCMIYMCAVVLARVYGSEDNDFIQTHFNSVRNTMSTLFDVMCDPSLTRYYEHLYDYPVLITFLMTFVVFGSFGINGLLTGVISEGIFEKNQARIESERLDREAKRKVLMQECSELFDKIDEDREGSLPADILMEFEEDVRLLFLKSDVTVPDFDLDHLFNVMDFDGNGTIEKHEFVNGIVELCEHIRPMSIMELHSAVSRCNGKIMTCSENIEQIMQSLEELTHELKSRHTDVAGASELMVQVCQVANSKDVADMDKEERLQNAESIMENLKSAVVDFSKHVIKEAPIDLSKRISKPRGRGHRKRSKNVTCPDLGQPSSIQSDEQILRDGLRADQLRKASSEIAAGLLKDMWDYQESNRSTLTEESKSGVGGSKSASAQQSESARLPVREIAETTVLAHRRKSDPGLWSHDAQALSAAREGQLQSPNDCVKISISRPNDLQLLAQSPLILPEELSVSKPAVQQQFAQSAGEHKPQTGIHTLEANDANLETSTKGIQQDQGCESGCSGAGEQQGVAS